MATVELLKTKTKTPYIFHIGVKVYICSFKSQFFQLILSRLYKVIAPLYIQCTRYTICIVKFSAFSNIFYNFGIQNFFFYPEQTKEPAIPCVTVATITFAFHMYKRNLARLISHKLTDVDTYLYLKTGISSLKML